MTKTAPNLPLSFSELVHARRIAALLVERLGDDYWPAFDCLDQELESRSGRENRLQNALMVGSSPAIESRTTGLLEPPTRVLAGAPCLPRSGKKSLDFS